MGISSYHFEKKQKKWLNPPFSLKTSLSRHKDFNWSNFKIQNCSLAIKFFEDEYHLKSCSKSTPFIMKRTTHIFFDQIYCVLTPSDFYQLNNKWILRSFSFILKTSHLDASIGIIIAQLRVKTFCFQSSKIKNVFDRHLICCIECQYKW